MFCNCDSSWVIAEFNNRIDQTVGILSLDNYILAIIVFHATWKKNAVNHEKVSVWRWKQALKRCLSDINIILCQRIQKNHSSCMKSDPENRTLETNNFYPTEAPKSLISALAPCSYAIYLSASLWDWIIRTILIGSSRTEIRLFDASSWDKPLYSIRDVDFGL